MEKIFRKNLEDLELIVAEDKDGDWGDVIMIQKDSVLGLDQFGDHSVDFIYIDGGHSYTQVKADIQKAKEKIKPYGWIGGHDYPAPCVKQAVHEEFDNVIGVKTSRANDNTLSSWLVKDIG